MPRDDLKRRRQVHNRSTSIHGNTGSVRPVPDVSLVRVQVELEETLATAGCYPTGPIQGGRTGSYLGNCRVLLLGSTVDAYMVPICIVIVYCGLPCPLPIHIFLNGLKILNLRETDFIDE